MALPASDNFNRANGTLSTGNWTLVSDLANLRILSNAVVMTVSDSADYWNADAFDANHYSECLIPTPDDGGPAVRCSSSGCYYWTSLDGGQIWRYKSGGTWTKIGAATAVTFTSSDVIRLEATGTTTTSLKVYKNGVQQGTTKTDSSSPLTTGSAGLYAAGTTVLDNWAGGNVSAAVVYTETGGVFSSLSARGVDQATFTDSGRVISAATISGSVEVVSVAVNEETGGASSAVSGYGADVTTTADSGAGVSGVTARGVDASTFNRTGAAVSAATVGGVSEYTTWTTSLVDYWKMDEASGNMLGAYAAKAMTQVGTVGAATGNVYATERDFTTGSTEGFTRDNNDVRPGDADVTIAIWFYEYNRPAGEAPTMYHYLWEQATYSGGYTIGLNHEGQLFFQSGYGGGGTDTQHSTITALLALNAWHLAIVWYTASDNTLHMQIDNRGEETPVSGSAHTAGADHAVFVGYEGGTANNTMDGRIGPIIMWNRVISAGEMTSLWNSGNGLSYESMMNLTINTEAGAGLAGATISGADVATFAESGAAVSALTATGGDVATFTDTGSGLSALTANGSDAIVFTEAGLGVAGATASGSALRTSIFIESGAGLAELTGSGGDVVAFVESGAGLSGATVSGTAEVTGAGVYEVAGRAVAALTATGAECAIYGEAGAGSFGATASGSSSRASTYIETGGAISDLSASGADVAIFSETGQAISALTATGADADTFIETGAAVAALTANGADAATFSDTGLGLVGATASGVAAVSGAGIYEVAGRASAALTANGAKVNVYGEAGTGIVGATVTASDVAIFTEAGNGLASATATGGDAVTFSESGYAVTSAIASGASEFIPKGAVIYQVTGAVLSELSAYGYDNVTFTDAGYGLVDATATAGDVVTFSESGYAVVGTTISGVSEFIPRGVTIYQETGAAIGELTGYGYDNATFTEAGLGLLDGVPLGADAVTMIRTGYGLVGVTISGPGQAVNTAFALHVSTGRVRLLNALYEVDKLTEYGIDCVTSIKEVEDGR